MFLRNRILKSIFTTTLVLASTVSLVSPAFSQSIVTDGKTNTALNTIGNTTNITTTTIKNGNAFNSFSKFNVDAGKTVNLVVPHSSNNLINIVTGSSTAINGVLNSVKDGKIGGNVFLLNPYGIAIGSAGKVNVGSLTAITPTKSFTDNFFTSPDNPDPDSVNAVLNGTAPVNTSASIINKGTIKANQDVALNSGNITNRGSILAKNNARVDSRSFSNDGRIKTINGITINSASIINRGEMFADASCLKSNNLATIVNMDTVKQSASKNIVLNAHKITIASGSINAPTGSVTVTGTPTIEITNNKSASSDNLQLNAAELGRINSKRLILNGFESVISRIDISRKGDLTVFADNFADLKNVNITGNFEFSSSTEFPNFSAGNITAGKNILIGSAAGVGNLKAGGSVGLFGEGGMLTGNIISGDFIEIIAAVGGNVKVGNANAKNDIHIVDGGGPLTGAGELSTGNLSGRNITLTSIGEDALASLITKNVNARGNVKLEAATLNASANILENGYIKTDNIKANGNLTANTFSPITSSVKSGRIVMDDINVGKNATLAAKTVYTGSIKAGGTVTIIKDN